MPMFSPNPSESWTGPISAMGKLTDVPPLTFSVRRPSVCVAVRYSRFS